MVLSQRLIEGLDVFLARIGTMNTPSRKRLIVILGYWLSPIGYSFNPHWKSRLFFGYWLSPIGYSPSPHWKIGLNLDALALHRFTEGLGVFKAHWNHAPPLSSLSLRERVGVRGNSAIRRIHWDHEPTQRLVDRELPLSSLSLRERAGVRGNSAALQSRGNLRFRGEE